MNDEPKMSNTKQCGPYTFIYFERTKKAKTNSAGGSCNTVVINHKGG